MQESISAEQSDLVCNTPSLIIDNFDAKEKCWRNTSQNARKRVLKTGHPHAGGNEAKLDDGGRGG